RTGVVPTGREVRKTPSMLPFPRNPKKEKVATPQEERIFTPLTRKVRLVVEWRDVRYYDCRNDPNATIKFQVVFQEGSGNVLFNYANAVFGGNCSFADAGGSATVGMQVAPGLGTTWSIDQQLVENDTAILWQTPPPTPAPNPIPTLSSLSP